MGDVVRKLRDRRGWTQADLARAAGVNPGTVGALEKSGSTTDQRTLYRVARALEVSVADLYSYTEPITLSSLQREWLRLLRDLDPERRDLVLQVARRQQEIQAGHTIEPSTTAVADHAATGTEGAARSQKP